MTLAWSARALAAALLLGTGCGGDTSTAPAPEGAGALDLTFREHGTVTTALWPAGTLGWSIARAVALQGDGKIVAAGYVTIDSPGYSRRFALARYDPNGALDASFGSGGLVTTSLLGMDQANAVVLQPDGKIVAAGTASTGESPYTYRLGLARYEPDGNLDAGFGTGGTTTLDVMTSNVLGIALQADGNFVVAGCEQGRFAVARIDAEGRLDRGFGLGGVVTTDFAAESSSGCASAVALQPDGKIVAAGWANVTTPPQPAFAVARYLADGRLDGGFSGGKILTSLGSYRSFAHAVAIEEDGAIVVGGESESNYGLPQCALARYEASGLLDPMFGSDGRLVMRFGEGAEAIYSLAVQPDGKLVSAGYATLSAGKAFAIARWDARGRIDETFGDGGASTDVLVGDAGVQAIAIQPDGKIVAAGYARWGDPWSRFAVARYLP